MSFQVSFPPSERETEEGYLKKLQEALDFCAEAGGPRPNVIVMGEGLADMRGWSLAGQVYVPILGCFCVRLIPPERVQRKFPDILFVAYYSGRLQAIDDREEWLLSKHLIGTARGVRDARRQSKARARRAQRRASMQSRRRPGGRWRKRGV